MSKTYLQVTDRDIAKLLVSRIPLNFDPKEFLEKTEAILKQIRKMPSIQKTMLKCAYIFSRKVPKNEREDLFQELTLKLLENRPKNESWAYTIARTDWIDWYRHYKVKAQYSQVDIESLIATELGINAIALKQLESEYPDIQPIVDTERVKHYNKQSWHVAVETLTGLLEYERIDAKLDARKIYSSLPDVIKRIASKRIIGKALTGSERVQLCKFLKSNPELVEQYQAI